MARIVTTNGSSLHPLLFEATWWRERLRAMDRVPRHLLVFPRSELTLPGGEAVELWLRAHDGIRLRATLGRSLLAFPRPALRVELLRAGQRGRLAWESIAEGRADLLFEPPPSRRLEDRVLDLLRVCQAARTLLGIAEEPLRLETEGDGPPPDEVRIADRLLGEGWA